MSTIFLDGYVELSEGANWLHASEAGWLEVIGAGGAVISFETVDVNIPSNDQCINDEDCFSGGGPQQSKRCINGICVDMNGDPCTNLPTGGTTTIQKPIVTFLPDLPNDGVVTIASQQLPGSLKTEHVDNVTHFGEQNNGDVQSFISDQFQLGSGLPNIFRIENCSFLK